MDVLYSNVYNTKTIKITSEDKHLSDGEFLIGFNVCGEDIDDLVIDKKYIKDLYLKLKEHFSD